MIFNSLFIWAIWGSAKYHIVFSHFWLKVFNKIKGVTDEELGNQAPDLVSGDSPHFLSYQVKSYMLPKKIHSLFSFLKSFSQKAFWKCPVFTLFFYHSKYNSIYYKTYIYSMKKRCKSACKYIMNTFRVLE